MNEKRLKILLANALDYLEEETGLSVMNGDLGDIIGITQEEYDEIMNNSTEIYYSAPHTFKIVKTIPARYGIWPIGNNMGSDKYIPFCEEDPEKGKYSVNIHTLLAVELPYEEVMLLRKAAAYGSTISELEEVLAQKSYCFENYVSRAELIQAIKILQRIMEDK